MGFKNASEVRCTFLHVNLIWKNQAKVKKKKNKKKILNSMTLKIRQKLRSNLQK